MPPRKKVEAIGAAPKDKKGEKIPTRDERAAAYMEWFNKKAKGRAQLKRASEYVLPFMTKRLPTGLLTLDTELRGGFPAGGVSQIVGYRNAGKSWMYWQVIRQLQHFLGDKMKVMLAMTEMRADRSQGRLAGVAVALADEDIELLERARVKNGWPKFTKEEVEAMRFEIGEIHELHGLAAEDLYDGILAAVDQNIYHLIVIDSFGMIMSGAEAEAESMRDKTYGGAAGVNTQFLHKLSAMLTMDDDYGRARDTCIIGINQVRDDIKNPNKEYKSTGGKALEHAKFVDLFLTAGGSIGYDDSIMTSQGAKQRYIQTGKEVNWKIEKGKAGIHEGGKGSFIYDFRINTANFYTDTFVQGVRSGVLEVKGSWIGIPKPGAPDEYIMRENSREKFIQALQDDAMAKAAAGDDNSYMNLIRTLVFRKEDININYDWD